MADQQAAVLFDLRGLAWAFTSLGMGARQRRPILLPISGGTCARSAKNWVSSHSLAMCMWLR